MPATRRTLSMSTLAWVSIRELCSKEDSHSRYHSRHGIGQDMGRWFLTIALVLAVSTVEMNDGLHFDAASRQVGEQGSESEMSRGADVGTRCNKERHKRSTTASAG